MLRGGGGQPRLAALFEVRVPRRLFRSEHADLVPALAALYGFFQHVPQLLLLTQAAAQQFVGTHDFLALCAAGSSAAAHGDTVRTITDCHVTRRGDEIDIEVTADGYLYNMVRILAGTLCEVGAGRMQPEQIPGILAGCDRSQAGPTLPAKGLFLKCVEYPDMKENHS